jgi:hypothetical protein
VALVSFQGCATSEKKLYPIEQPTIKQTQFDYEQIPKPIKYENPSIDNQKKEFDKFLKSEIEEIDNYKMSLNGKGYGKNENKKQKTIKKKSIPPTYAKNYNQTTNYLKD